MRFIYLFFILSLSFTASADVVTLRVDAWCPYVCDPSENPKNLGFMVDIAKEILESNGHKLDYKLMNWPRAIKETREGKFNTIIGAYKTDAPGFIFPAESLGISRMCFFVKKDDPWKYTSPKDFEGHTIGFAKDYTYGPEVMEYIKNHEGKFFTKDKQKTRYIDMISSDNLVKKHVEKLLKSRIKTFIEDVHVTLNYLKENNLSGQIVEAGCAITDDVHIAFSPHDEKKAKSEEYAKLISDGIKKLRIKDSKGQSRMDQIMDKYGLTDWKK